MSYIFISYNRKSTAYADRLVAQMDDLDIPVWIDRRSIPPGARWRDVVENAITDCAAMIVLMTPEAHQSEEVQIEIQFAKDCGKPRLPLLLEGEIFPMLRIWNCVDVTSGDLPGIRFFDTLRWHLKEAQPYSDSQEMVNSRTLFTATQPSSPNPTPKPPHPPWDPGYYQPLRLDLNTSHTVDEDGDSIDITHPLWQRLNNAGAETKGNRDLKPVQFIQPGGSSVVGAITYRVRRPYTESGALSLGNHTLLDAVKAGDQHPFWAEVGLDGVPLLWGSAAVVVRRDDTTGATLLLGLKRSRTRSLSAVFADTLTPPAGIVDIDDFVTTDTLREALIEAARRELYEETGLELEEEQVRGVFAFLETGRCKQQAFVLMELPPLIQKPDDVTEELKSIGFYDLADPAVLAQYSLSPESRQAHTIMNNWLAMQ